jgi:hypothetical protein
MVAYSEPWDAEQRESMGVTSYVNMIKEIKGIVVRASLLLLCLPGSSNSREPCVTK